MAPTTHTAMSVRFSIKVASSFPFAYRPLEELSDYPLENALYFLPLDISPRGDELPVGHCQPSSEAQAAQDGYPP